jgi:hypothetical protein
MRAAFFFFPAVLTSRSRCLRLPGRIGAVVTGGNKGIELEVCRQLAGSGIAVVVLTARDETRGAAAVEKLRGLGLSNVVFHQLDITDAPSIARLVDFFKTRFGKLDILVNNAGFIGLEYMQDHIDGTSTTSEKVRRFPVHLQIIKLRGGQILTTFCFLMRATVWRHGYESEARTVDEMVPPGVLRCWEEMRENKLPRHEASHPSISTSAVGFRRWKDSHCLLSACSAQGTQSYSVVAFCYLVT